MGKSQRDKGARGELEVVKMFKTYGFDAYRSASAQRAKDAQVCDVEGTPFWVEVKRQKQPNIHAAFDQAHKESLEAKDTRFPVAFTKKDRGPWLVTLDADVFLEMVELMEAALKYHTHSPRDEFLSCIEEEELLEICDRLWGRRANQ